MFLRPLLLLSCISLLIRAKYLVLGLRESEQLDSFLPVFSGCESSSDLSFNKFGAHALIRLYTPNVFGQKSSELLFLRHGHSVSSHSLVSITRWANYSPISGIIILDSTPEAYQEVFKRLLLSPSHDVFITYKNVAGVNTFVLNDIAISWKNQPSRTQSTALLSAFNAMPKAPILCMNRTKSLVNILVSVCLSSEYQNGVVPPLLFYSFFDLFLGLSFPTDLLKYALEKGYFDIVGHILRPLAPHYIQSLGANLPKLGAAYELVIGDLDNDAFIASALDIGYSDETARLAFARLCRFRAASNGTTERIFFSLNQSVNQAIPIFSSIIAGRLKGLKDEELLPKFVTYLHWLQVLTSGTEDRAKTEAELQAATADLLAFIKELEL